jgi:hypothetical protein
MSWIKKLLGDGKKAAIAAEPFEAILSAAGVPFAGTIEEATMILLQPKADTHATIVNAKSVDALAQQVMQLADRVTALEAAKKS